MGTIVTPGVCVCVHVPTCTLSHTVFAISFHTQVALVYGQMNEPPGARARVALTGLTVAEYFRDQEGQDVLLFIDNIFRFTQAGSEVRLSYCKLWKEVVI